METFLRKCALPMATKLDQCMNNSMEQAQACLTATPVVKIQPEVRTAFASFDTDGNGHMDIQELRSALDFLGITQPGGPCSQIHISAVLDKFDGDGNGSLELQEFQRLINYIRQLEEAEAAAVEIAKRAKERKGKGRQTASTNANPVTYKHTA